MKKTGLMLTALLLLAACAAPVQGQTLGDAARREAERRARLKEPTKVITNADIAVLPERGGARPAAPAQPAVVLAPVAVDPAAPAAAQAPESVVPAEPMVREKRDEQHWRERARVLRERLTRLQTDAAALDGRVKSLNAEIDAASGPQRTALAREMRQAAAMLVGVQGELRLMQGEWRQFEDRAVREKIPTAWIR